MVTLGFLGHRFLKGNLKAAHYSIVKDGNIAYLNRLFVSIPSLSCCSTPQSLLTYFLLLQMYCLHEELQRGLYETAYC